MYAQKKFILLISFKKFKYFHFFPHSKSDNKLCKNGRVGRLEAGFQKVTLVQIF